MPFAFLYKCRRCGAIERGPCMGTGATDDTTPPTIKLLDAIRDPGIFGEKPEIKRMSIHACSPNAVGVSDLIGFEPE